MNTSSVDIHVVWRQLEEKLVAIKAWLPTFLEQQPNFDWSMQVRTNACLGDELEGRYSEIWLQISFTSSDPLFAKSPRDAETGNLLDIKRDQMDRVYLLLHELVESVSHLSRPRLNTVESGRLHFSLVVETPEANKLRRRLAKSKP